MTTAEAPIAPISFYQPRTAANTQHSTLPEDKLREELQRDGQREHSQGAYTLIHLGGEDEGRMLTQSVHALDRTPPQIQLGIHRRTKTGCMNCKKQKKKCDETRPECILSCYNCKWCHG
jgi:hypothetical protein